MEHLSYPNESVDYRAARNALLDAEIALPPGGAIKEDYAFERIGKSMMPEKVHLSELFEGKPAILIYSFMYGPDRETPCTGCTHLLDGIDGTTRHVRQRMPVYVVAKSPIARLTAWARERGWDDFILLSTAGNSYDADYFGDTSRFPAAMRAERGLKDGEDWDETIFNVFRKDGDVIRHFWGSEMAFAPTDPGQNHRAGDLADPVWALLDMAPNGRGDFFPKLAY